MGGCMVLLGVTIQVTVFDGDGGTGKGSLAQFMIGRVITGTGNGVNMASSTYSRWSLLQRDTFANHNRCN